MEQPIQDKAKKPAGLVPKNLQAFLLVGLALLMVVIMALTGHKPPTPVGPGTTPALPTIVPVNADRVTDFQKSIEQSQRDSAPQAEAALLALQKQLAAQTATSQPSVPNADATADNQLQDSEPAVDTIREEQKKRAYLSLFSDNIALSYRKELHGQALAPRSSAIGMQPDSTPTDDRIMAQASKAMNHECATPPRCSPRNKTITHVAVPSASRTQSKDSMRRFHFVKAIRKNSASADTT